MEVQPPLISVVMTTYNHENYIAEAIQSVLDQSFADFELIIVNDGSTDRTDEIIRSFQSERIIYIYQDNQGPSAATNNGILTAKGKYVALMSGDDICYPQRLERQYHYVNQTSIKSIFSWVDFIDDSSQPIIGEHFAKNFFNHGNRTQAEILNFFFMEGNYLCAVTAFVEKEILGKLGLFNLASIQLQDFDMWIKLVKKYEIFILPEKLVKYRIKSNGINNLSADPANYQRKVFELYQIQKNIFNQVTIKLFKEAFKKYIKKADFKDGAEYELEKAFLYLSHSYSLIQSIGYEKLFSLLQNKEILSVAQAEYGFGLPELYKLTKNVDITNSRLQQQTQAELERWQFQQQQTQVELEHSKSQLQHTQVELEHSKSQLQHTQVELEHSKSQLQHTQVELEHSKSQLQHTQVELEHSKSQLQHTQIELEHSKSQLQHTQIELEHSKSQLQHTQIELEHSKSQLQHTQIELEHSKSQLQHTQIELERSQQRIKAMESSKFWKLRKIWFNLKQLLGLKHDE